MTVSKDADKCKVVLTLYIHQEGVTSFFEETGTTGRNKKLHKVITYHEAIK